MKLKSLILATTALFAAQSVADQTSGQVQFTATFVESICSVAVNSGTTPIIAETGTAVEIAQVDMGLYALDTFTNAEAAGTKTTPVAFTLDFSNCPTTTGAVSYAISGTEPSADTTGNLIDFDGTSDNQNILGLFISTDDAGATQLKNDATEGTVVSIGTDGTEKLTLYAGYQAIAAEGYAAQDNAVTTVNVHVIYN